MAHSSPLVWTLASIAVASACLAWRWASGSTGGGVVELGEAEHEFNAAAADQDEQQHNQNEALDEQQALAPAPDRDQDVGAAWDNDDRARRALEERQAAQDPERVNAWKLRGEVGTKKAKSLAKRDQRRAYYEYVRQQAEARREEVKVYEDAFGDLIAKEREDRQRKIDAAKAEIEEYNNFRRQLEEEERNDRRERRERISNDLRELGKAKLDAEDGIEVDIAESITGALVLENEEYAITVGPRIVDALVARLRRDGRVGLADLRADVESVC